uniref:Uncharacterized protein n=1 Tax=Nelumbo nucifera TaxID=4432 RepID=A0A822XTE1_NELNU|nr:TPA_asm: hypothetical protein HUJ06_023822 [Nelumbo nucifera]
MSSTVPFLPPRTRPSWRPTLGTETEHRQPVGDNNNKNNGGRNLELGSPSEMESDPLTTLTLAQPGVSCSLPERRMESFPAEFWDMMREVIAREVKNYVSSSVAETVGLPTIEGIQGVSLHSTGRY